MSDRLSVIIPLRAPEGSWRVQLAALTGEAWIRHYPEVDLCYGSDGRPDGRPFNCAAAVNAARRDATGASLAVFGADHLPPRPEELEGIVRGLERLPWFQVYANTHAFSEVTTARLIEENCDPTTVEPDGRRWSVCTGIVAVRAEVFDDIGGYDERFEGWGYEDTALRLTLATLYPEGRSSGEGTARTLWHPPSSRAYSGTNRALYREYERAARRGPRGMRRYIERIRHP